MSSQTADELAANLSRRLISLRLRSSRYEQESEIHFADGELKETMHDLNRRNISATLIRDPPNMTQPIRYIVDKKGVAKGVIVPLKLWKSLLRQRVHKKFSRTGLRKYLGTIHIRINPVAYQDRIRDEWT
ncbi:MAG: hypothetical protein A2X66_07320 [Ignavibacteria bacterium GWA2_54_16]|nr:MAG: hypothetical protein A2X66_07320 [Ignavibacteria bacterium GWA2_54_16]